MTERNPIGIRCQSARWRAGQPVRPLTQETGLPFSEILSAQWVRRVVHQVCGFFRERSLTPLTTLWVFLSRATGADGSWSQAAMRLVGWFWLATGAVWDAA